jgi:hypothetical protein
MGDVPLGTSNSLPFNVTATATIFPLADTIGPNGTRQFTAVFNGQANISWEIQGGPIGGTISPTGLYAAPAHVSTFHIVATSVDPPFERATATVTVVSSGFSETGSMNGARSGHTATLHRDEKVLIVGGGDSTAELFDPTNGTFSVTGPPLTGRLNATATLLADGRVLIVGGLGLTPRPDGSLPTLNSAEIFDPPAGTFSSTGSMIQHRNHTAATLDDGRVLVAGGYFGTICTTASAELFDFATGTFSSTGFMHSERVFHTATQLKSGEVLMVGGSNGCAPDSSDDPPWDALFVEVYEPEAGNFLAGADMRTTRIGHADVRRADGKVLVLGGIPAMQNLHQQPSNPSDAELFDPAARTFSAIAGLTISSKRYTATLLTSGLVLIVGGENAAGTPATEVQLLDPSSAVLNPTGALGAARVGHTVTLLQDGRVLITGGTDARGSALATAELYSNRTTPLSVAALPSSSAYLLLRRSAQQGVVKTNKIVFGMEFFNRLRCFRSARLANHLASVEHIPFAFCCGESEQEFAWRASSSHDTNWPTMIN